MSNPKKSWRWQSEEPQTIVILIFILSFIFIVPPLGCNPQRNDKQWAELKRTKDIDSTVLERAAKNIPQPTAPQQHQPH